MFKFGDIVVALAVIGIVLLIVIPIPNFLMDILLTFNISLSLVILLISMYTKEALQFSIFPSLLLVTTLFRLCLNISSTKLILGKANAGKVIESFGNFVIGNNPIVGIIIFLIIVIIQFMVITKGAERVAEVSARFTLDAMPGKQMAIDADLNSGLISEGEARERRRKIQREADFYGAMDGASKFVKGDAIAGIIITIINLVGGVLIFSLKGMGAMEALDKFGKLTIGDGLVSQIPALLISIASGILVTRSADGESFGKSVSHELFGVSQVLMVASVILLIIGFVPAFPTFPFLIIAVILGCVAYLLVENEKSEKALAITKSNEKKLIAKDSELETISSFQIEPISVEIGYGLIPLVDEGKEDNLINHITAIRRQCANELGIIVNPIRIRDNLQLGPNEYVIKIKGNKVADGSLYINKYLALDPGNSDFEVEGIPTKEPAFGIDAIWIDEGNKERAEINGYTIVEPITVFVTHLKEVIKDNSYDLLGRQEVKQLLDGIKEKYNVVVEELIPNILTLGEVQKVLQNLLKEKVPITDLVTILESLADNGTMTKDIELLTEQVRFALKRTITMNYVNSEGKLDVITIHPDLEELIGNNIQKTMNGSIPVLKPNVITKIFDGLNKVGNESLIKGMEPVILASPKIRAALRNLISFNFPNMAVLSINEIPNDIEIEAVGLVENI